MLHGCFPVPEAPPVCPHPDALPPPPPWWEPAGRGARPGRAESSLGPTEMPAPGAQVQLSFNCFSALGSRCLWPVSTLCPRGSALCRVPPAASLSPQSLGCLLPTADASGVGVGAVSLQTMGAETQTVHTLLKPHDRSQRTGLRGSSRGQGSHSPGLGSTRGGDQSWARRTGGPRVMGGKPGAHRLT